MNYSKLDAALASVMDEGEPRDKVEPTLSVFIKLASPPSAGEQALLDELGVRIPSEGRARLVTARLTRHAISTLSDQPSVAYIQLSQARKLLDDLS